MIVILYLAAPQQSMKDYFYKNTDADEMIFVHEGRGIEVPCMVNCLLVMAIIFVIPRGTIYQIEFVNDKNRLFIVESFSPIRFPKKYLSKYGQLMEHSPYCERDIRPPQNLANV